MGRITIAIYRPKKGKEQDLLKVVEDHMPVLQRENLITDRKPIVMQAADKSIVEVFEWKSSKAIEEAHHNPEVQKLWERFGNVCEYVKPVDVQEFHNLFSEFTPIN
jgi:quinol monooxygenase YgiN